MTEFEHEWAAPATEGPVIDPYRKYKERIANLEYALETAISWSYGVDVTPEERDEVEKILKTTTTEE
jgi:hypothetical protein